MNKPQSGKQNRLTTVTVTLLALSALTTAPAVAGEASLEECRALKERIDHYTSLRRMGGSASQMNEWKKQRRRAEKQFRDKGCNDYRRELRR
ncbi:MAG: hypothetical protein U5K56_15265 [Halioglobus sp.]|nr:hypothetical protein [Halioglobus sp.]